jgi:hypothetical protein
MVWRTGVAFEAAPVLRRRSGQLLPVGLGVFADAAEEATPPWVQVPIIRSVVKDPL